MRRVAFLIVGVALLGLASGCMSTNVSGNSSPLDVHTHAKLKANLTMGGPVSGEATVQKVLFFQWGPTQFADGVAYSTGGGGAAPAALPGPLALLTADPAGKAKSAAAFNALSGGADVIVDPHYVVTVTNFIIYKKIHCKVTGTGATVAGYTQE